MSARRSSRSIKGGVWVSVFLHAGLVALLFLKAPNLDAPKSGESTVDVVFDESSLKKGDIAPPPKAAPKPPAPPVPQPAPQPQPVVPPKIETPPEQDKVLTAPNSDSDPVPEKTETPKEKAPEKPIEKPREKPPQKTQEKPKPVEKIEKPEPKPVEKPAPKPVPKVEKTDDSSLMDALSDFKSQEAKRPSKPVKTSGQIGDGGLDATTRLSAGQQHAIGDSVRKCYEEDTEARNYDQFSAHLVVTVDGTGVARGVDFAPETMEKMASDRGYAALARRARDAVLSSSCAKLPVPDSMLGKTHTLRFVFRP